jgi:hypothetical protein
VLVFVVLVQIKRSGGYRDSIHISLKSMTNYIEIDKGINELVDKGHFKDVSKSDIKIALMRIGYEQLLKKEMKNSDIPIPSFDDVVCDRGRRKSISQFARDGRTPEEIVNLMIYAARVIIDDMKRDMKINHAYFKSPYFELEKIQK